MKGEEKNQTTQNYASFVKNSMCVLSVYAFALYRHSRTHFYIYIDFISSNSRSPHTQHSLFKYVSWIYVRVLSRSFQKWFVSIKFPVFDIISCESNEFITRLINTRSSWNISKYSIIHINLMTGGFFSFSTKAWLVFSFVWSHRYLITFQRLIEIQSK